MVQTPGLRIGNSAPLTLSFLRMVSLKQFISSLSISMDSSISEIIHEFVLLPEETLSVTAPLPYSLIYGRLSKAVGLVTERLALSAATVCCPAKLYLYGLQLKVTVKLPTLFSCSSMSRLPEMTP